MADDQRTALATAAKIRVSAVSTVKISTSWATRDTRPAISDGLSDAGALGAVRSGHAAVDAVSVVRADTLPAASNDSTPST